jgi:hypothetical protein
VVEVEGQTRGRFLIGGIVVMPSGYRGLLLGQRFGRELRYVGTVEWRVGHRRHRDVFWREPRVVAEVTFSEFVNGWLRDPVLRAVVSGFSPTVAVAYRYATRDDVTKGEGAEKTYTPAATDPRRGGPS